MSFLTRDQSLGYFQGELRDMQLTPARVCNLPHRLDTPLHQFLVAVRELCLGVDVFNWSMNGRNIFHWIDSEKNWNEILNLLDLEDEQIKHLMNAPDNKGHTPVNFARIYHNTGDNTDYIKFLESAILK